MDIKDPIGHNASVVEMIRRFRGVFFFPVGSLAADRLEGQSDWQQGSDS